MLATCDRGPELELSGRMEGRSFGARKWRHGPQAEESDWRRWRSTGKKAPSIIWEHDCVENESATYTQPHRHLVWCYGVIFDYRTALNAHLISLRFAMRISHIPCVESELERYIFEFNVEVNASPGSEAPAAWRLFWRLTLLLQMIICFVSGCFE